MSENNEEQMLNLDQEELLAELEKRDIDVSIEIINETDNTELAELIRTKVLPADLSIEHLKELVSKSTPSRISVWATEELLEKEEELDFDLLESILIWVEPYREEAWKRVRKVEPNIDQLHSLLSDCWVYSDRLGSFKETLVQYYLDNIEDTKALKRVVKETEGELQKKVWEKFMANSPNNQELISILDSCPPFKDPAWDELSKRKLRYQQLNQIIDKVDEEDILEEAIEMLLDKKETTIKDILSLMKTVEFSQELLLKALVEESWDFNQGVRVEIIKKIEGLRDTVWNLSTTLGLSDKSLKEIVRCLDASSPVYKKAARRLLSEKGGEKNLRFLLRYVDFLKREVWPKYKKYLDNQKLSDLISIRSFPDFAEKKAANLLLEDNPNKNQLESIIKNLEDEELVSRALDQYFEKIEECEEYRKLIFPSRHFPRKISLRAAEKLMEMEPTEEDLKIIEDEFSSLEEEAEELLKLKEMNTNELQEGLEGSM